MSRGRVLLLVAVLAGGSAVAADDGLDLAASTDTSDTGSYQLTWSAGGSRPVTVQEATRADFSDASTLYRGPDGATVISGRFDGVYHYRARRGGGPWSEPIEVTVAHHSLAEAFAYLSVGAVVFLATVAMIVGGHLRHRREYGIAPG